MSYKERVTEAIEELTKICSLLCELSARVSELQPQSGAAGSSFFDPISNLLPNAPGKPGSLFDKQRKKFILTDKKGLSEAWTKKELKEMPYLKDLHYRFIDGIHQYRYRRNGYDKHFSSKYKEVAKQKAYDFIRELNKKLATERKPAAENSLDYIAYAWLDLKKAHVVYSTYRIYEGIYKNHISPVFGKKTVKSILPMHLQPFFNELFKKQERTVEDAKIVLNGIFKYAVANRMCTSNPMQGVIIEKHFRTPGSALTDEQIARFKTVMQKSGKYGLAGLIILYSGVRGAELSSIRFDWAAGTMDINNAKLKKSQKRNPKNLIRTVPIFPKLYTLKDQIQSTDEWRIKSPTLSCHFRQFWGESTVKDLRHTFISKLRESGIENELVNIWTGHAPGKNLTANTYTHFSMEFQKKQAKKIKDY